MTVPFARYVSYAGFERFLVKAAVSFVVVTVFAICYQIASVVVAIRQHSSRITAQGRANNVCNAMQAYQTEYGALPNGSRKELMAILQGANPKAIVYYEDDSASSNAAGELVDPWGTPYRIGISRRTNTLWAYSCGPNQIDEGGGGDDCCSVDR